MEKVCRHPEPAAQCSTVASSADYIGIMLYGEPGDTELMRRMANGEIGALRELYSRHSRLVYGLALRIIADPETAEEICQDVFLRAWEKADTYRSEKAQVRTWLARIARNRSIDVLRRRGARDARARDAWEELKAAAADAGVDPSSPVEEGEARQRVSRAVLSLPQDQREALSLAFFDGLTHRQIAEATGEPLGTVKSRIRAAMVKLRELLRDDELS
ncbi:MAG TPA: sigma-70 family RNA polymerase sigma factor [Spirochaetia bacterium]|nr:sigma-70 family RNA polymerase sigma factor [Spirochaetia bacterium]